MISKREYLKAQKTIRKYQEQLLKGKYQFLYFTNGNVSENVIWIKAKNIDDACQRMRNFINETSPKIKEVDYEVFFNEKYIDISKQECLQDFM